MKKTISLFLAICLCMALAVPTFAQEPGPGFGKERDYNGEFSDVKTGDWFYTSVTTAYEWGLLNGRDGGVFGAKDNISVAEVATIVARVNSRNTGNSIREAAYGDSWYAPYLAYLAATNTVPFSILTGNPNRAATRAELAAMFARALPEGYYDNRNGSVVAEALATDFMMADVRDAGEYAEDVFKLYESGLVNGMDEFGSYLPAATTTRAEVAAILMRLVDPDQRVTISWDVKAIKAKRESAKYDKINKLTKADLLKYTDARTGEWFGYAQTLSKLKEIYTELWSSGKLTESMSEREKARVYFDYLVAHTKYGQVLVDTSGNEVVRELDVVYEYHGERDEGPYADGPLVYGRGTCNGYTAAYNLLLALEGIRTEWYSFTPQGSPFTHARTKAVLDSSTVYIDTTWNLFDCEKDAKH